MAFSFIPMGNDIWDASLLSCEHNYGMNWTCKSRHYRIDVGNYKKHPPPKNGVFLGGFDPHPQNVLNENAHSSHTSRPTSALSIPTGTTHPTRWRNRNRIWNTSGPFARLTVEVFGGAFNAAGGHKQITWAANVLFRLKCVQFPLLVARSRSSLRVPSARPR